MALTNLPPVMAAMQAVANPYELRQVKTAQTLRPYDLSIKTVAASLCHTDLLVVDGILPASLPITASHEGSGIVTAVGSAVRDFKIGDRVMSGLPLNLCGKCEDCLGPEHQTQYCQHTDGNIGLSLDGVFADYHVADSRTTCLIPDKVDIAEASALACAGRTVYRAFKTTQLKPGQYLAIVGAGGGLGHLGVQFALAQGIKVIAIDARDAAFELCKAKGAEHVLDAREGPDKVAAEVRSITGTSGADATLNLSAHPTALMMACAVTRAHGTVIQVAGPDQTTVPIFDLVFRDITVKGTMIASGSTSREMLAEYAKHGLKVESNLFHGLHRVPEMVETLRAGTLKGKAICVVDSEAYARDCANQNL